MARPSFFHLGYLLSLTALQGAVPPGFEKPDVDLTLKTLPGEMKYDQSDLKVKPGQKVKLTLQNQDQLPHNLVVINKKGEFLDFAQKAWALGEHGNAKNWIPEDPRLIAATPMVDPGHSGSVYFVAPAEDAVLDFVCTFPGHAMIMHGQISVSALSGSPLKNLTYMLYKGFWEKMPQWDTLSPDDKLRTEEINNGLITTKVVAVDKLKSGFGLVFNGTLTVPKDGQYRFFIAGDDGVRLTVDDQLIVEDDGIHPAREKVGRWFTKQGEHRLKLEYFQAGGQIELSLALDGPGMNRVSLTDTQTRPKEEFAPIPLAATSAEARMYRGFLASKLGSRRLIAVSYPGQTNLTFDQDAVTLTGLWKGAFLDAGRHWTGRGAGDINVSGYALQELGREEGFALLPDPAAAWPALRDGLATASHFTGYRLDAQQRPTFRYTLQGGAVSVEDTPQPQGDVVKGTDSLQRTLTLSGTIPAGLHFRVVERLGMAAQPDGSFKDAEGLIIRVEGPLPAVVRGATLLVPIPAGPAPTTLKLTYRWM
jgi:azurin